MELHEIEKELEDLGLEILTKDQLHKDIDSKLVISVQVDIDTSIDYSKIYEADYVLKKYTGRKDHLYISFMKEREGTLTFTVTQCIPQPQLDASQWSELEWEHKTELIGTTFPDLCWYHSEGTTHITKEELMTKFREKFVEGDLTWFLPSRFLDNFIEIMHTLNQSILEGLMQEAIVYGPVYEVVGG